MRQPFGAIPPKFNASVVVFENANGTRGSPIRCGWGIQLTPRHRSALVAALASASLIALICSAAAETASQGGTTTSRTAAKHATKAGKVTHKKSAAKSKDKK